MSFSIDVSWKSLNKQGEELCGDKVEVLKTEDSDIVILADGMGSGVKANILATLTSKILGTMLREGASIESCVETVAKTLPICKVRKVAYATFSILQIFHSGEAYLAEFDNPSCVFIRDGKIVKYPYEVREIEGKKVHESRFQVKKNDCFTLMSDGVIYAGAGSILNLQGWTWEAMSEYTLKCTKKTLSASRLAVMLCQACDELYERSPGMIPPCGGESDRAPGGQQSSPDLPQRKRMTRGSYMISCMLRGKKLSPGEPALISRQGFWEKRS